jgi:hypothetical protein
MSKVLVKQAERCVTIMKISKTNESVIWTNPQPLLRSRHSCFPFACELDDGTLLASHVIAEAFESVDGMTRLAVSRDKGVTWDLLPELYDKSKYRIPTTDSMKLTNLGGGHLLLFGYEFFRENPNLALANAETGGLLDDRMIMMRSYDNGHSWTQAQEVPCRWGHHVEASSPVLVLANGDWVSPIAEFPRWDGSHTEPLCGRLLRSGDSGQTWNDEAITVCLGEDIGVYEQRVCQLEQSGAVVVLAWNEDLKTGEPYNNHYAISYDNGRTFQGPFDTGIRGQASSVCAIGRDRLLSLHAMRKGTSRPGIYAYIVNLENGKWEIENESIIWEPDLPMKKNENMAEIFAYLTFGQPGAVQLSDGTILTTHWVIDCGQGKTVAMKLLIE